MKRDDQAAAKTALLAFQKGDYPKAEEACRAALKKHPKNPDLLNLHGVILRALGRSAEAIGVLEKGIAIKPNGELYANLGVCLLDTGKPAAAAEALRKSAAINDKALLTWVNLGVALNAARDPAGAEEALGKALAMEPNVAEAYVILAQIAHGRGDIRRAIELAEKALSIKPRIFAALELLGILHFESAPEAAEKALRQALEVVPQSDNARFCLAMTLEKQARCEEALAEFERTLELNPRLTLAQVMLVRQKHRVCDWRNFDADVNHLRELVKSQVVVNPFIFLTVESTAEEQLTCSRTWVREKLAAYPRLPVRGPQRRDKIRVGYLSSDLHEHATAYLMAELWERHDRSRFEIIAYSYGRDDGSAMRQRLTRAFDRFVDLRGQSFEESARAIHQDEVDILIDLKGYTGGARTEIMAYRPAPITMNFIGYPGTMGAEFIDYIVADRFLVPAGHDRFYSEKVIRLPNAYQPNDTKRQIAARVDTRADHGLPDEGFVFCSFNSSYKITPALFDIWMRLLKDVPGSVLWLLKWNTHACDSMRREAEKRGVDPARLVFAPPLRLDEHLARHRHADIFLDTLPVNAHTTASDSLWAGLPVLTCAGDSFVSRVAGSLVSAVGLPELVTTNLADYEAMALRLAREPGLLAGIKARLAENRLTAPLFDIERFTRDLERAYELAYERWLSGQPPCAIDVESGAAAPAPAPAPRPAPAQPAPVVDGRIPYQACPLCGHGDFPVVHQADISQHPAFKPLVAPVMNWCRCASCGHVFAQGHLAPETEQAFFDPADTTRKVAFDLERQRALAAQTVKRVIRHQPAGRWLDVEAGNAALMFTAEEWGFHVAGLDRDPANVQMLRQLGYAADQLSLEEVAGQGAFDVISLMGVLDSRPHPRQTLEAAARLLSPGGVLVLSAPNAEAMLWRILTVTTGNPFWAEFTRTHNFGRARLTALLAEFGFDVVEFDVSDRVRVGMEMVARKR